MKTRHLLQLVLLSALWGASFLFIRIASPVLGPQVAAALRIGLATLTLVAIMRATREPWPWQHWRELTGLAYWLNLRVLSQISPVAAMSSAFMIPLFGVAWGHLFLGEALGPGMLWGGALVLLATSLVTGFNPLRLLAFLRAR